MLCLESYLQKQIQVTNVQNFIVKREIIYESHDKCVTWNQVGNLDIFFKYLLLLEKPLSNKLSHLHDLDPINKVILSKVLTNLPSDMPDPSFHRLTNTWYPIYLNYLQNYTSFIIFLEKWSILILNSYFFIVVHSTYLSLTYSN